MGRQSAAIGVQLRSAIATVAKALTLEVDNEVRQSTPVGTGRARAHWVPSVGAPVLVDANGSAAHAAGVAQVMRFKLEDGVLWISNGVDYVPLLNYGRSDQAPAMFIEAAMDRATATIQSRCRGHIDIGRSQLGAAAAENLAAAFSPFGGDL